MPVVMDNDSVEFVYFPFTFSICVKNSVSFFRKVVFAPFNVQRTFVFKKVFCALRMMNDSTCTSDELRPVGWAYMILR
jgi:hypothetical protein